MSGARSVLILSADDRVLDRRIAQQATTLVAAGFTVHLLLLSAGTFVSNSLPPSVNIIRCGLGARHRTVIGPVVEWAKNHAIFLSLYHWLVSYRNLSLRWQRAICAMNPPRTTHIIANDLPCLEAGLALREQTGARLLFDAHEIFETQTDALYAERLKRYWRDVARRLAGKADAVSTVTSGVAEELRVRYGLAQTPAVLQNCCYYVERGASRPSALHELYGLSTARRLVLCVGELRADRHLEELIDAVPHLAGDDVDLAFLGFGSDGYIAQLRRRAERLGVADRVHIGQSVAPERVVEHAAGAALGVITNRGEGPNNQFGGPNRLFEYIQARLPILSYEHVGVRQVLSCTGTGWVQGWASPAALAEAIMQALVDANAIAADNFEQAARRFSWEQEGERLLQLMQPGDNAPLAEQPAQVNAHA